mmetsp:Transcript_20876/g.39184  ORF Transcript_20876/g.39184 Transcript_20876/m.39184 type:complete len:141 (+) Transcript_20876:500-922(+)
MVVQFFMSTSSALVTRCSDSASNAEVASSSSKILGSRRMARAIATLCFWPPESCTPRSPTMVSYFSGNPSIKSWQLACFAAAMTLSWGVSGSQPYKMLSLIEHAKSAGSWDTTAIRLRSHSGASSGRGWPSMNMLPLVGS